MIREEIVEKILIRLASELPSHLTYHAVEHTYDVIAEVRLLAGLDELSPREQLLLTIAAAFHDAGFLFGAEDHEQEGARLAQIAMREDGGYTSGEVALVEQMIGDTKIIAKDEALIQSPSTSLSGYLLDSDLANLGRPDFFEKMELVRQEQLNKSEAQFKADLLKVIKSKVWYTPAGKRLRESQHKENISLLTES